MSIVIRMPAVLAVVMMSSAACSSSLGVAPSLPSLAAPSNTDFAPLAAESALQPASVVTISSSSEFQSIPLLPASYSETVATTSSITPAYLPPTLPSYTAPATPINPEFGVPMSGADYILQPIIPAAPKGFAATPSSLDKPAMITAIARTVEYHSMTPPRGLWAAQKTYATNFGNHPLVAR